MPYSLENIPFSTLNTLNSFTPLEYCYPKSLTSLTLMVSIDLVHVFIGLPPGLRDLTIYSDDYMLEQPFVTRRLPAGLKVLNLYCGFNQTITKDLFPPSIEFILFGGRFNKPITELPASATHLSFGNQFAQEFDHQPVRNLWINNPLTFKHDMVFDNLNVMTATQANPEFIRQLSSTTFPNLERLQLLEDSLTDPIALPMEMPSLRLLLCSIQGPITQFPQDIDELDLGCAPSQLLTPSLLPSSLQSLVLRDYKHVIKVGDIPSSVTLLGLYSVAHLPEQGTLPSALRSLILEGEASTEYVAATLANQSLVNITVHQQVYGTFVFHYELNLFRISDNMFFNHPQNNLSKYGFIHRDNILALHAKKNRHHQ
ncbi:hypothetical protein SAMD00019534_080340 [Acytostelium subglobosum LB1]|uniref:hypothetical protein n=1 Tax=Acytostelium subglobosum LB1 TaxID=1410327 RepID=UPI000644F549|nr:hypothetical protein SAMD00019534_080340 [Acytostelium subglobosum LB1]GAM24859.1 hypothetical protein SAMD00019534_080340 [Acytostelium subglobosum LB1]|eukprot:XP_012751948.1 hypothetical protein SAMD00019534_080340 [Acytostelium subglobosum LB1]